MSNWEKASVIVNGYAFFDAEDAKIAQSEQKKVEYLKNNLQNAGIEVVYNVYCKAISERFFRTPIGTEFLKELQVMLQNDPAYSSQELPAIPLYVDYDQKLRSGSYEVHKRVEKPKDPPKEKVPFIFISVVLNIVLVVAVICMFLIALNTSQPNILNYEKALINQYSYWEQELTEREAIIREKELELDISSN